MVESVAALATHGAEVPGTHDLLRLVELQVGRGIATPGSARWIDELNAYAVEARFGMVEPGELDRQRTLAVIDGSHTRRRVWTDRSRSV